jgi:hypothetical protein
VLFVLLAGSLLFKLWIGAGRTIPAARAARAPAARPAAPLPTEPISIVGAAYKGSRDAKAVLVIYSDFDCPFCARFAVPGSVQERAFVHGLRLLATVMESGRPVVGLVASDFEVTDEGVAQRLDSIAQPGEITVGLAVDASWSVRTPEFERTISLLHQTIGLLSDGDRGALTAFSDRVLSIVTVTEDKAALRRGLDRLASAATGPVPVSMVWDATMATASLVATADVPLLLLFSDGMDNASWLDKDELGPTLMRAGLTVDFLRMPWDKRSHDGFGPGRQTPESLAARAAGRVHDVTDVHVIERIRDRFAELRAAYVLTYTPRGVGTGDGWHEVRVRVRGRRATVRTRPGYVSATHGASGDTVRRPPAGGATPEGWR